MRISFLIAVIITLCCSPAFTQGNAIPVKTEFAAAKPYKIITSGTNVTIRCNSTIKSVLVWTSEGRRIVEEKAINAATFNFRLNATARYFFIMIQLKDGKSFSEKLAIRN